MTKFLNISVDNTLGGNSPSDVVVSSQKALKEYIDAHSSGSPSWGSITGTLSNQTDLQNALNAKQATLVSGTNIKTVDGKSLLGSGNLTVGIGYGTSTTAAANVQKEVSIPSITTLNEGQIIVIQPTITSTVANSTLKLNDFPAYPMRYNNAAITTSTDSTVWNADFPSQFVFDGEYWVFLGHGIDSNPTINFSIDAGNYTVGLGTYAVNRYALIAQKEDGTWERLTDTTKNYSTATTKTVNTRGFILNQLRYYSSTSTYGNGEKIATNRVYQKAASVNTAYSFNCSTAPGWAVGDYIYLVGTIGADGLFYLDTTQWWSNALPSTNDGKLYIRLGLALTSTDATMSLFSDRPIFYHDGTKICEYKVADNKQDTLVSGTNIKTINNNSILGSGNLDIDALPSQTGQSGKFLTTNGTNASWANVPARNIGEIVESTIPLTDAGLHLLDGALISGAGSYSAFVTYIAGLVSNYPDLFITETAWQQSVTDYGVCGKFVYDSVNNTVRLPKITGFTEGAIDPTVLGNLTEAGLPEHRHIMFQNGGNNADITATSFVGSSRNTGGSAGYTMGQITSGVEPSLGISGKIYNSTIYGNSSTVQPQSIKVLYYIVIATSTKTSIEVDINEIATDLNGKADVDLSNCTKPHIVETYVNGTSWYRVYSDGWCEQGGRNAVSGDGDYTVNLLKTFRDTNYSLTQWSGFPRTISSQYNNGLVVVSMTNSSFTYNSFDYDNTLFWQATGYIS